MQEHVRPIGPDLALAFRELLASMPGAPHTPTPLARLLGMNRVITSKLLGAIARPDPFEVLQLTPGPESLRAATHAAASLGVPQPFVDRANSVIDRFAKLIREDFGTRSALSAAISTHGPDLQVRFEHAARYQIYKGIRAIRGVEAETWLVTMLFTPSSTDSERIDITAIDGALGMRRLRPDVNVYVMFGPPNPASAESPDLVGAQVRLHELYSHEAATVESSVFGGRGVHRLIDKGMGKHALVDMLGVSHIARSSRRYASPERKRGGAVVFPDIPVKMLVWDVLIHDDLFPAAQPELLVYNPGARGPVVPLDPARDIDRIHVPERIETVGKREGRFTISEVPNYAKIVERVAGAIGADLGRYRVFRVMMPYPVHGFQFAMAFDAPPPP
jgi:hypothetical protein